MSAAPTLPRSRPEKHTEINPYHVKCFQDGNSENFVNPPFNSRHGIDSNEANIPKHKSTQHEKDLSFKIRKGRKNLWNLQPDKTFEYEHSESEMTEVKYETNKARRAQHEKEARREDISVEDFDNHQDNEEIIQELSVATSYEVEQNENDPFQGGDLLMPAARGRRISEPEILGPQREDPHSTAPSHQREFVEGADFNHKQEYKQRQSSEEFYKVSSQRTSATTSSIKRGQYNLSPLASRSPGLPEFSLPSPANRMPPQPSHFASERPGMIPAPMPQLTAARTSNIPAQLSPSTADSAYATVPHDDLGSVVSSSVPGEELSSLEVTTVIEGGYSTDV